MTLKYITEVTPDEVLENDYISAVEAHVKNGKNPMTYIGNGKCCYYTILYWQGEEPTEETAYTMGVFRNPLAIDHWVAFSGDAGAVRLRRLTQQDGWSYRTKYVEYEGFVHFDQLYQHDARHAYVVAAAFAVAHDVDEVYAALRMYRKTNDLDLIAYLHGNVFADIQDKDGDLDAGRWADVRDEAHDFIEYMDKHGLVTWPR